MQFTMANDSLPVGAYRARFMGCEPFTERSEGNDFGPAIVLHWQVLEGQFVGADVSRVVSAKLSAKSNLGKFSQALKGGPIAPGETIDLRHFSGVVGTVIIGAAQNSDFTRVESFLRDAPAPQQPQQYATQSQTCAPQVAQPQYSPPQPAPVVQPPQQVATQPAAFQMAQPQQTNGGAVQGYPPSRQAMSATQGEIPF